MVSPASFHGVQINPLENQHKLRVGQFKRGRCLRRLRNLKRPFFQALVEYPKPVTVPEKQFDAILAFVDKDVYRTRERILFEDTGDDTAQPLKTFAHIGRLAVKKESENRGCPEHVNLSAGRGGERAPEYPHRRINGQPDRWDILSHRTAATDQKDLLWV
jgi:hypothetical protein